MPLGEQLAKVQDILHHASHRLHICSMQTAMARAATSASAKPADQPKPQACATHNCARPACMYAS